MVDVATGGGSKSGEMVSRVSINKVIFILSNFFPFM